MLLLVEMFIQGLRQPPYKWEGYTPYRWIIGVASRREFSIVFPERQGSPREKRSWKRNACNSHLIPKMDAAKRLRVPSLAIKRYQMYPRAGPFGFIYRRWKWTVSKKLKNDAIRPATGRISWMPPCKKLVVRFSGNKYRGSGYVRIKRSFFFFFFVFRKFF